MSYEFETQNLGLRLQRSGKPILKDINLQLKTGSLNILLGQNGSGKSMLMKCLAGLQSWTGGEVLRRSQSRKFDREGFNEGLVFVSEEIRLPAVGIQTLAKIYTEIWNRFDAETFARVLAYGKIKPDMTSVRLSRGQRALLQLALALAVKADTFLIDEVTAVLDPFVRNRIVEELVSLERSGEATVLVATNIATEFAEVNANVILLDQGQIYMSGVVSEVIGQFAKFELPGGDANGVGSAVELMRIDKDRKLMIARREDLSGHSELLSDAVTLEEVFIFLSSRRRS